MLQRGGLTTNRFIKFVLLILLSPFVLFMLGLVLSIVLLDDFLNDDD